MKDLKKASLAVHRRYRGKLEIKSKIPLKTRRDLSLAYTPGVAEVSTQIAKNKKLAYDYTFKNNSVAIVSNGTAVLGLGDIGPEAALPVMEGKALLFKQFANVDAIPLCINSRDVDGVVAFVKNIAPTFGGINLEDIAAPECFEILDILRKELDIPVMHDDQQGTAAVVLAATINSLKVVKKKKEKIRVVINGAGSAGIAIARLFLAYGFKDVVLCDSRGPIYQGREKLNKTKQQLSELTNLACQVGLDHPACAIGDIGGCVKDADLFIGVSRGNILTAELIKQMKPGPIIFALANPTPEVMPDIAKKAGASIVATGRSDFPNQINNVLVFPGVFRGALDNRVKLITDEMLIKVAKNLAGLIKNPTAQKIVPSVFDKKVAKIVAKAIK